MSERLGGWIQTYTGGQFWPLDPLASEIDILDIAHSLSMQCRFNGHISRFYSVAEHCCHVADLLPDQLKMAGLLHDASEAYLCDLPSPLKTSDGFAEIYGEAEARLDQVIARRFDIGYPHNPEIKDADRLLLHTEALQLMNPLHAEWPIGETGDELVLPCWSPEEAESRFMGKFLSYLE